MILYIETNFIMATATGRDANADALLHLASSDLRIAVPAICLMEAWSSFEDERKRRNFFRQTLDMQISQLLRDVTSTHAKALVQHLQQARTENFDLLNDIRDRLGDVQRKLAGLQAGYFAAEILPLTLATLAADLAAGPTKDPTDNLILTVIQEHALQNPDEEKAFLSGNTRDFDTPEIRALLASADIADYFARTDAFLGWFQAQGRPTLEPAPPIS